MIRLITTGRLHQLAEAAEQARTDAEAADARAARLVQEHAEQTHRLSGLVESAESDAAILRDELVLSETALKQATVEAGALWAELEEARRVAAVPMALLLFKGAPHSVHGSVQAAKDHAATLGANPSGWSHGTVPGATLTGWSVMPFHRNGDGS
ncbi:hypothetical protein ACFUJU_21225 [Streptomyces sp. NPDC057235]|uniref:hypothetical protein n=1 Tax=Streptomyces sp. NPDC057235 TaxID=3346058 RepID=UPI003631C116